MTSTEFDTLVERARRSYAKAAPDDAIAALAEASRLATDAKDFRTIMATHLRFGRFALAQDAIRDILAREPGAIDAYLQLALMKPFTELDDDARAMLDLEAATTDPAQRSSLRFALGKVFQDIGDIERSFSFYDGANRDYRGTIAYATEETQADAGALVELFTPELFAAMRDSGNAAVAPIFIVGMPRSGSTLTEHILATHRDVFGGGEMNLLGRVERTMREQAGDLGAFLAARPDLKPWGAAYLEPIEQALRVDGRGKTRFTDKLLANFRRIGLIKLMFPHARIVHCLRDPLDNLFSIYRRPFVGSGVLFGFDQLELADYYRTYRRLMQHWHDVLPGFVHDVRYETLVGDAEPTMRALLEFCDLDWDPRCLEFYRTERGVATNSLAQVRRPLYSDSIGMAAPYRAFIGPLIDAAEGLY